MQALSEKVWPQQLCRLPASHFGIRWGPLVNLWRLKGGEGTSGGGERRRAFLPAPNVARYAPPFSRASGEGGERISFRTPGTSGSGSGYGWQKNTFLTTYLSAPLSRLKYSTKARSVR